jgi:hypothetical protein
VPITGIFAGSSDTTCAISCVARITTEVVHKTTARQMHERALLLSSSFFFATLEAAPVTNTGCAIFFRELLQFIYVCISLCRDIAHHDLAFAVTHAAEARMKPPGLLSNV